MCGQLIYSFMTKTETDDGLTINIPFDYFVSETTLRGAVFWRKLTRLKSQVPSPVSVMLG